MVRMRIATRTMRTIKKNGLHRTAKKYGVNLNKFSISYGDGPPKPALSPVTAEQLVVEEGEVEGEEGGEGGEGGEEEGEGEGEEIPENDPQTDEKQGEPQHSPIPDVSASLSDVDPLINAPTPS